jgi:hypothetical protein
VTPADFRLADFLGCLAASIHETRMGRPARAEAQWLEAQLPASDLFRPGTDASDAAGVLIAAVRADGNGDPAAANKLHNALDVAGEAAAMAARNRTAFLRDALGDAYEAVVSLPEDWRDAICTLLAPVAVAAVGVLPA